jgi:rhamnose utilization protein RhaD (predicted bifunctional aldolase and dehydrogenase)/NAD(P)-dependent dehydrogenase (short-subunit alcohol dehydrogenase family)
MSSAGAIASQPGCVAAGWDETAASAAARQCVDPRLGRCVYVSRLLGSRADLALHGGGNTSVKSTWGDPVSGSVETLWVKGSGRDLATVDAAAFAPLVLESARRLLSARELPDAVMARELRRALLDPAAPSPSVETLAHAALPHAYVLHAHPDAVLAATSTPGGRRRAGRLFGPAFAVLPWVTPGFALGRAVAELWERQGSSRLRGIVLLHHGVLTFAEEAEEAWAALAECAARAAEALPPARSRGSGQARPAWATTDVAALRQELSRLAGRPLVLALDGSAEALAFANRSDVAELARRGPLTPDHVLRTKRTPVVVGDARHLRAALARYARDYQGYFRHCAGGRPLAMLDPAPRVVIAAGLGVLAAGVTAREADAALELYRHTWAALVAAEALGGHRPLRAQEVFEVEYWDLEQAKRLRAAALPALAGRVALVTGAASGIGRAVVEELMAAGAATVGVDLAATPSRDGYLGLRCDVRAPGAVTAALEEAVRRFGGLDLLISNVGVFPPSRPIEELPMGEWRAVMEVNATSHAALLRDAIPLLRRAAAPPAVVFVGSRNALAPGPGAAAYSASKAALSQLARVAALELAPYGVRVNVVHPDGVFDTGIWRPEVLAERAGFYGLTVDQYRRRNLLHTEVHARDVARLAAALCTDLFACTTGAQIPVDGGDPRVI